MKLFTYFRSSASFRVRIALNLKGLDYEAVSVHLKNGEHRNEKYLDLNPTGLIPTLIDNDLPQNQALGQSMAILEYLDETHPEPPLIYGSAMDKARIRALANIIACDIHPLNNLRILHYLKNNLAQDQDSINIWYQHWIIQGFDALEKMVDHEGYCFGDKVSLADLCLIPQIWNAERFKVDMSAYPALREINTNLLKLEAFDKALPENQFDAEV